MSGKRPSPKIARKALDHIGKLYDVEREIAGRTAKQRLTVRKEHSAPEVDAFHAWSVAQLARIPEKGDLAKTFRYALNQ